ncbi:MAG: 16S rRNA (cytidine(1402)-2'-O)-methyltransferase [Lachnospiraceae bacterium]|nr:16S rRNA (cytidine(1402)-2'-O)-methyltransferase [Lachnospiraceae bacterium]
MSGKLYVVATPIGNLSDFSERAIETLRSVDLIAAEDTRNTIKLLTHFDIHTPQTANHKFNERQAVDRLVREILDGKSIAVVSDAGTPCINDPGFILVEACAEAGIDVVGVPGCCAAATVVSVSGLPSDSFLFMGFFPREKRDAEKLFDYIAGNKSELYIFYESPKRIIDTMELLSEAFPAVKVALCNDLTKTFERIYRGTPAEVLADLKANPNAEKGEYAFAMYVEAVEKAEDENALSLEAMLTDVCVKRGCTLKEAISLLSTDKTVSPTGKIPASKKELYQASLNLKELF